MSEVKKRGRPRKTDQALKVQNEKLTEDDVKSIVKEKRHRNRPDLQNFGADLAEPGDNTRFLRMALEAWDLPPIDISDPEQVKKRLQEYFNHCAENDRKPTVISMANWLGISRDTLSAWKRGEFRSETHAEIIKKAYAIIEEQWADYMLNGKVNPAAGIFLGKNWFQYADAQQIVVTPQNPYDQDKPDSVRDKYLESMQNEQNIPTDGNVE